jgi:hypothetical protein
MLHHPAEGRPRGAEAQPPGYDAQQHKWTESGEVLRDDEDEMMKISHL